MIILISVEIIIAKPLLNLIIDWNRMVSTIEMAYFGLLGKLLYNWHIFAFLGGGINITYFRLGTT